MDISEAPILADLHARLTLLEKLWLLAKIYYWKFVGIFIAIGEWWYEGGSREDFSQVHYCSKCNRSFISKDGSVCKKCGLAGTWDYTQDMETGLIQSPAKPPYASSTYYTGPMPTSSYYTIKPKYLHTVVKRESESYIPNDDELFSRFGFKQGD